MNLDLMRFLQEAIYLEKNMERMQYISMIKTVKEHSGFHYLMIEMQLHTLILLKLNIFVWKYKKIRDKSLLTIYLEYNIMNLLCVDFIISLSGIYA